MYPEFAHELEVESGLKGDLRDHGTIFSLSSESSNAESAFARRRAELEPDLAEANSDRTALCLNGARVIRGASRTAGGKTATRGVDFSSGEEVQSVTSNEGRVIGVTREEEPFNSAKSEMRRGRGSGQIPARLPTRPVKGPNVCLAIAYFEIC